MLNLKIQQIKHVIINVNITLEMMVIDIVILNVMVIIHIIIHQLDKFNNVYQIVQNRLVYNILKEIKVYLHVLENMQYQMILKEYVVILVSIINKVQLNIVLNNVLVLKII